MIFTTKEQVYKEFPFLQKLDTNDIMLMITSFMMSILKKSTEDTIIDAAKFLMDSR
jgi:hypothetical protein